MSLLNLMNAQHTNSTQNFLQPRIEENTSVQTCLSDLSENKFFISHSPIQSAIHNLHLLLHQGGGVNHQKVKEDNQSNSTVSENRETSSFEKSGATIFTGVASLSSSVLGKMIHNTETGKSGGFFGFFKKLFGGGFLGFFKGLTTLFSKVINFMSPFLNLIPGIGQIANGVLTGIKGVYQLAKGNIKDFLNTLIRGGINMIPGAGISSLFSRLPFLSSLLGKIFSFANQFKSLFSTFINQPLSRFIHSLISIPNQFKNFILPILQSKNVLHLIAHQLVKPNDSSPFIPS